MTVTVALMLIGSISAGHAQNQSSAQEETGIHVVSSETYDQVLDMIFPRDVMKGAIQYAFVLRYKPPFSAESQITIRNEANRIEVVEYRSSDGNIRNKLSAIFQRTHREDVAEMAKQIRVEKRVVNLPPAEVKKIRRSFYDRICQSASYERRQVSENVKEVMLIDDGTHYLLWYRGAEESYYDLLGHNVDITSSPADEHPLIDWMRAIRRTVKKFPTTSNQKP